jgi:Zn-dependent protease
MLKQKELISIIALSIIFAAMISFFQSVEAFLYSLLSVFIIISINIVSKKILAYHLDSEIEVKIWALERWGLGGILISKNHPSLGGILISKNHPSKEFKNPFLMGAFLPIISKIIFFPVQGLIWMGSLVFETKTKIYGAAKRHHKLYSFSEITEYQIGLIAAVGILSNLVFAFIGYLVGLPPEMNFVKLSIFYAFFNMIPLSNLDGNKIYFGNQIMWYTLSIITLIGFAYAFLLI